MKVLFNSLTIACLALSVAQAELYTASSDIEPLLDTHNRIIEDLESYVKNEETRLSLIKKEIERYKTEQEMAMKDVPNYLGNPLNAFTLIKRLTRDLDDIDKIIKEGSEFVRDRTIDYSDVSYPTEEDLFGAAVALSRLQATYKLETKELADGILNHVAYSTPLSAHDCFHLGRVLYTHKHYENSIAWMMEALRKLKAQPETNHSFTEVEIYDYISYAHHVLGRHEQAIEWVTKLLEINPGHNRCRANFNLFKEKLNEKLEQIQNGTFVDPVATTAQPKKDPLTPPFDYETLCRGEIEVSHSMSKGLYCYYEKTNHPFLKLAPIKAEQKYKNPDAFIFYDVISDSEIQAVQELAKPSLKRAVVNEKGTGKSKTAEYRISKTGWLHDGFPVVPRISRRVSDFTGLAVNYRSAEDLQIANYGIGGHYEPHYDMGLTGDARFSILGGNRIATVLFYMSEVAQGGATVFTELGLSVFPIKHAALFWWNLFPSCEADVSTRHAGCPVLRGSKWVANKWIHNLGQELKRPCTLEYQPEGAGPPKPRPIFAATPGVRHSLKVTRY